MKKNHSDKIEDMVNLSFNVSDIVGVSDHVKMETEIDAVIYRREFEQHEQEYLKTKVDSELIMTFICLQIYIECFLHQNMRRIIDLEFKPPCDAVATKWEQDEGRYVYAKMDEFGTLFFTLVPPSVQQCITLIKDNFSNVTDIRNKFAHGHKISTWSDSDGNIGTTPAKSLLTEVQLDQSKADVNVLGLAWNELLDAILPQLQTLRCVVVDDLKFKNL